MRIGIDYRFAARTTRGIGMYIREMVRELMNLDQDNEYILYLDEDAAIDLPINFSKSILPYRNILLFEQIYLPRHARKDRLDVLWYPSNSGPVFLHPDIKLVVTVHDMISFMQYNAAGRWSLQALKYRGGEYYRRFALELGLKRIDRLTTVSEFSAAEIRRMLGRTAEVIPNHINPGDSRDPDDGILQRLNLQRNAYFFTMTGDAPHKNLKGLLNVFSELDTDKKLVISGVKDMELMRRYPQALHQRVIITGYITDQEKASLYRNAYAFLFFSLYEGFGIPLLEAMQHHIPVIASNRSSIPEVLGKGGMLVNPESLTDIKEAIRSLEEYDKEEFQELQDEQLAKYSSWAGSARRLHVIFTSVSQGEQS